MHRLRPAAVFVLLTMGAVLLASCGVDADGNPDSVSMAVIAAGLSLVVSCIAASLQWANHKAAKGSEERAEQRRQESLLSLEMIMANNKLSYACAMAIKRGEPNGELEAAISAYDEAKHRYDDFIRMLAVKQMRR